MRHGKRVSGADRRRRKLQRAQAALGLGPARMNHPHAPRPRTKAPVGGIAEASDALYTIPVSRRVVGGAVVWPERYGVLVACNPHHQRLLETICANVRRAHDTGDEHGVMEGVDVLVRLARKELIKRRHAKRARVFRAPGHAVSQGGRSSPAPSPEFTMDGNHQVATSAAGRYWEPMAARATPFEGHKFTE
ncbi:MAG: hypothetical protein E6R03_12210 [Hyphomicrobiaceae bacterium]|nr:MAG: hypothetical protein E6R03_12210 [Hyphomicrobiaceae bacterium]